MYADWLSDGGEMPTQEDEEHEDVEEEPEEEEPAPERYVCVYCRANLDPDLVWEMESHGPGNREVLITYHCICTAYDAYQFGRYPARPLALAYLVKFDFTEVRRTVNGTWSYENPVKLRAVAPVEGPVREFREDLHHVVNVDDFIRRTGKGYPPPEEPSPSPA